MSSALKQLALAIGGIMFVVAMAVALLKGVPLLVALFRAIVIMCLSAVAATLFFRFFTVVLYRFIQERMQEQARAQAAARAEKAPPPPQP